MMYQNRTVITKFTLQCFDYYIYTKVALSWGKLVPLNKNNE